jgi:hypothetical protein
MYATVDGEQRQNVSLVFVNKSSESQVVQVNPAATALSVASPWRSQNLVIGGNSVVLVTLHRNAGAEAYSFTVPATNDAQNANVGPMKHVQCTDDGTKDANTVC